MSSHSTCYTPISCVLCERIFLVPLFWLTYFEEPHCQISPFELSSTHIPNLLIPINMKFTEKDWLPRQDHLLKITRQQQPKASDTWFFSILCPLLVPRSPPWGSSCVGSSVCCSSFLSVCLYGCNGISGSVIPLPVASDDHHVCFSAFLCLSVNCRVL